MVKSRSLFLVSVRHFVGVFIFASITIAATAGHAQQADGQIVKFNSADKREGVIQGFELKPSVITAKDPYGRSRAHSTIRILVPTNGVSTTPPSRDVLLKNSQVFTTTHMLPVFMGALANTPSSLACVYNLTGQPETQTPGCNPNYTTVNPNGGGGAIALVLWDDDPTAVIDLNQFSDFFGLPRANITVVYAGGVSPFITGTRPPVATGDDRIEESLDIEWAHAMAPRAKLVLVEAQSNLSTDVFTAVAAAQYLVSSNGGGEISMSFGFDEDPSETTIDGILSAAPAHVVQLASSGDRGGVVSYPSSSPNVVSVGGTTFNRDPFGNFLSEGAWSETGGGVSTDETRPSFQSSISGIVGNGRGTPDIAMVGDPGTGAYVYSNGNWYIVGGTSLATPLAAGVLNIAATSAGTFPDQSALITTIYSNGAAGHASRDVSSGTCGGHNALSGYDLCTGWGVLINPADKVVISSSGPGSLSDPFQAKCASGNDCDLSSASLINASESAVRPITPAQTEEPKQVLLPINGAIP